MWFTYFGITRTEAVADGELTTALRQCIRRAYLDLSRRVPYQYSIKKLKEKTEEERNAYIKLKKNFKLAVEDHLVAQIGRLLDDANLDFDTWHKGLCSPTEDLCIDRIAAKHKGLLSEAAAFSVGLSQKWVNMTLKNMLVMGPWDDRLLKRRTVLHIPVDSYILDAARVDLGKPIFEREKATGLGVTMKIGKWSQIDSYQKYMGFQEAIRQTLAETTHQAPIDWEGPAWIAQAKKNKTAEDID